MEMQNCKVYYMPNNNDAFVKESDADKAIKEAYNKAIDDALSVVEWDGYTIDIKERIEQLKGGN